MFVPKGQRSTAQEKKAAEEAEKAALEREEARLEERREETKALVAEAIHLEEQKANAKDDETVQLEAIDTDDDEDDETEFDSWRRRELDRIRCARAPGRGAEQQEPCALCQGAGSHRKKRGLAASAGGGTRRRRRRG